MNYKAILSATLAIMALACCRKPQPLDIAIPHGTDKMVISSNVVNEHLIIVTAGYSIRPTANLTMWANDSLPAEIFIDSAIITINAPDEAPVSLHKISPGIYSTSDITLKPDKEYKLTVADCKKGLVATATTSYITNSKHISVSTNNAGRENDSLLNVDLSIDETAAGDCFFVSYSTVSQLRKTVNKLTSSAPVTGLSSLVSFEPKQIQLFDGGMAKQNKIQGSFMAKAGMGDTLVVQVARIDKAYYKYLTAYKRTGYFINQLTGEPINLPSNIKIGYGYFALYQPQALIFDVATGAPIYIREGIDYFINSHIH